MRISREVPLLLVCSDCAFPYAEIVYADGLGSAEFATIDRGLKEMARLATTGEISTAEAFKLAEAIMRSGLEKKDPELDEFSSAMAREKDELLVQIFRAQQKVKNERPDKNSRLEARGKRSLN